MLNIVKEIMDKNILKYLEEGKVFTMATTLANYPYCANCFYAFDKESNTLIFLSDDSTKHIKEAIVNNNIAGTIQNGVTTVAKIKGIQFTGKFVNPLESQQKEFYSIYYKKFPFAKMKPSLIWGIQLDWIKMTDNTLGFGTKLIWER